MTRGSRAWLLSLFLLGCGTPTELVVILDVDLDPAEVGRIEIVVEPESGPSQCAVASSIGRTTLGVSSTSGAGRLTVRALEIRAGDEPCPSGRRPEGSIALETRAEVSLVAGERRIVHLVLAECCRGAGCDTDLTCRPGEGCVSPSVATRPFDELESLDAGLACDRPDGGSLDAGFVDADVRPDAGEPVDGGCAGCPCGRDRCVAGECVPSVAVTEVAAGWEHTCAVTSVGLYCWGENANGQLGLGTVTPTTVPLVVPGFVASHVTVGSAFTCATDAGGLLHCWGASGAWLGQGEPSPGDLLGPTRVQQAGGGDEPGSFAALDAGQGHVCAIRAGRPGELVCWGFNPEGALGNGTRNPTTVPGPVNGPTDRHWLAVAAGHLHTCAILEAVPEDDLYCWGASNRSQAGYDMAGRKLIPDHLILPAGDWRGIAAGALHTCGVGSFEGTVSAACLGLASSGQLGLGSLRENQGRPTVMVGGPAFERIAAGEDHSCAIDGAGELFCWGDHADGALGLGPTIDPSFDTPQRLDGGPWIQVSAGNGYTCAVREGGALYCWGTNAAGRLGTPSGDMTELSPVRVCFD